MATVVGTIMREETYAINTNKGYLYFNVAYIAEDVNFGDQFIPRFYIDNQHYWTPLSLPNSVFASNIGGLSYTFFESNDGDLKFYESGSSHFLDLYDNGTRIVHQQIDDIISDRAYLLDYMYFVSANNIPFFANLAARRNIYSGGGVYVANSADAFGQFSYSNFSWYDLPTCYVYENNSRALTKLLSMSTQPGADNDPFAPGGTTEPDGGTGTFTGTTEPIDFPSEPQVAAVDTGFITLYNPSLSQLSAFANYLWGTGFDLDQFKKLFNDPMSAVLGMSILPVAIPNGGSHVVHIGNIATTVSMNKAASQFVTVDCGSLSIEEYWGSYLDYDPYTKAEIYLPYIGTHAISVDDIMGKTIHVKYRVDILSGACCANIKCGNSVLYSFVGQCSCSVPISGNDWTNMVNGALSIAASIGSMVATGGASAPLALTEMASTAVNSMKPSFEKSGSMGGMGGMMGIQKPYIIITRPRQAVPQRQNTFMGYPSFITKTLDDCEGYTEVESVHLEEMTATKTEVEEIETLLKSGVIF